MKSNNKLIIVIIVILIIALASAVFAYLFLMTDIFKSNKELFVKYFGQNEEMIQKITDLKTVEAYKNLKNESKYESNTNIKFSYSEGGEISNPLNDLSAQLDIQKDDREQYSYIDGQILYKDEEYLETEFIKENDIYGIRFPYAIQQFITVENDESINEIMSDIGLNTEQTENSINLLKNLTNNKDEISNLKNKYLNIVASTVANGKFEKQKDAIITYNNNTIKTNAYTVLLSREQVENMLIELLNNLKDETEIQDKESVVTIIDGIIQEISGELEIPEIKITVYEYNKNTIKTLFEVDGHNISIENMEQDKETITRIIYTDDNSEQEMQIEIDISKINNENEEKLEVTVNVLEGTEEYTVTFSNIMQLSQEQINVDTEIEYKKDITTISLAMENNLKIGQDFEKSQTIGNENSRLINSLEKEKRKEIINIIKNIVVQKTNERINLLTEKMGTNDNESENVEAENGISQVEINKFNAKFEFYIGEEVSAENVKMLLEVVKNNMSGYEFIPSETQENSTSTTSGNNKVNIRINIEKDKTDEEGIKSVLEKISSSKKYKVSINYKEPNGVIEYINITEK